MRRLPNLITALRLLASPVLAWLIVQARFRDALWLALFAGVTDWLDGFAARHLGAAGQTGVVLDPLADKVLLVTLFIALTAAHLIPLWLLVLVVGRDLVIVIGALMLRMFRSATKFLPSLLGKISTFFQIMLVLIVLVYASFPNAVFELLNAAALALTTIFSILSGVDYVRLGWRIARNRAPRP